MTHIKDLHVRTAQAYLVDKYGNPIAGFNGKSAYEIAVELGFKGTEDEWILSLKGPKGDSFKFERTYSSKEEMEANFNTDGIDAGKYVIISSNNKEDNGNVYVKTSLGYLFVVNIVGHQGESAYDIAVKNGYTGTEQEWLETLVGPPGQKGESGKSAYDIAVELGFQYNVETWLASLKGDTGHGEKGDPGKSAYAVAQELGYKGTKAQWIASLKGDPGEKGDPGQKGDPADLSTLTYTNLEPTKVSVGAIKAGTTFNNMPLLDIITRLLYGNPLAPKAEFGEGILNNNIITIPVKNINGNGYTTTINKDKIISSATIKSISFEGNNIIILFDSFVIGVDTLSLREGTIINTGDGNTYVDEEVLSNAIASCDSLVEVFNYYCGEIGIIRAESPDNISQENWEEYMKPNGTNGNMVFYNNATKLEESYEGPISTKELQWWIMLIPNKFANYINDYIWEQKDDITMQFSEYPDIVYTGRVVLDNIEYFYSAIRPNAQLPTRFIKK